MTRCPSCGALGRSWSSSHSPSCEGWTDPLAELARSEHTERPVEEVAS